MLERSRESIASITSMLIGDYAIRAVASLENLSTLAKISGGRFPDAVLVDLRSSHWSLQRVSDSIAAVLPNVPLVGVGHSSATDWSGPSQVYLVEIGRDSMALSSAISRCLSSADVGHRASLIRYKDISLNCDNQQLKIGEDIFESNLPHKEMQLLRFLIDRRGQVVSRADIQNKLWYDVKVSPRTIDSHVSRLRLKLQGTRVTIRSIYGGGYILR